MTFLFRLTRGLMLVLVLFSEIHSSHAYYQAECDALTALYDATNGPGWTTSTNWATAADCCTWWGVTCDGAFNVTTLSLDSNQLSGSIPVEIGQLTALSTLHLHSNQLSGSIPVEIGQLTELSSLYLSSNQLSGSIPVEIGELTALTSLYLHSNQLSGSIPVEIGELTALTSLYLHSNQLSGSIPVEIGELTALTMLGLNRNDLTGSIPVEIGELTALTILYLDSNQLSGSIPAEIGQLTELSTLTLNSNQLNGSIPVEIGQLIELSTLSLHGNQLSGSIPVEIGQLTALSTLFLYSNQLSGSIPVEIGQLTALSTLFLHSNQLSGSIPVEIGQLTALSNLHLNGNQLSGSIPVEIGQLTALSILNLYSNQLSGSIPVEMSGCVSLKYMHFYDNQLSGTISAEVAQLPSLVTVSLYNNQFSGCLPRFTAGGLTTLKVYGNSFTGVFAQESLPSTCDASGNIFSCDIIDVCGVTTQECVERSEGASALCLEAECVGEYMAGSMQVVALNASYGIISNAIGHVELSSTAPSAYAVFFNASCMRGMEHIFLGVPSTNNDTAGDECETQVETHYEQLFPCTNLTLVSDCTEDCASLNGVGMWRCVLSEGGVGRGLSLFIFGTTSENEDELSFFSDSGTDMISFAIPSINADSLNGQRSDGAWTDASAEFVSSNQLSGFVRFSGSGFPPSSEYAYMFRVTLSDENGHYVDCSVHENTTHDTLACEIPSMPTEWSTRMEGLFFTVEVLDVTDSSLVLASVNVTDSNLFYYAQTPVVTYVRGCTEDGSDGTIMCPTQGNVTVSIHGAISERDITVFVDVTKECTNVKYGRGYVNCTLPAGTGVLRSVTVSQHDMSSTVDDLISYTEPIIAAVSGCANDSDIAAIGCPIEGNQTIIISGSDFGTASAVVYIGSSLCTDVTHTPHLESQELTCVLPSGVFASKQAILLAQFNGLTSVSGKDVFVEYANCADGTYQNTSGLEGQVRCSECPPGKYTGPSSTKESCDYCGSKVEYNDLWGQDSCFPCAENSHSLENDFTSCICDNGYILDEDDNTAVNFATMVCTRCDPGTFYNETTGKCNACPPGTFSSESSTRESCEFCSSTAQFNDLYGQSVCKDCPANSHSLGGDFSTCLCDAGFIFVDDACIACDAGTEYDNTTLQCEDCAPGKYSAVPGSSCALCPSNILFIDLSGQTACIECADNAEATDNHQACQCKTGYFDSTEEDAYASLQCLDCTSEEFHDGQALICDVPGLTVATIGIQEGFWRESSSSLAVYKCLDESSCPAVPSNAGESISSISSQDACVSPQTGPLCVLCEEGYFSSFPGEPCVKCVDSSYQGILFVVAALAAVLLIMFYVRRTMKKADKEKRSHSVLMKILFSAMQLNSIALTFSFSWNDAYTAVATTESSVSSMGATVLQLGCFEGHSSIKPFYLESLLFLLSPLIILCTMVLLSLPAYMVRIHCNNSMVWSQVRSELKELSIVAGVIVAFLLHPTLSERAMQMFDCTLLDDEWYLSQQLDEVCWSSRHVTWVALVGIPLVAMYAIGIPLVGVVMLYRNRNKIGAGSFHKKFSFLYKGYAIGNIDKPWAYAWEGVVSLRKLALMLVSVFFYSNPPVQTSLGLLVVVSAGFLHAFALPFDRPVLNQAETLSLLCSSLTFFLGGFTFLDDVYVDASGKEMASYAALVVNFVFLCAMLFWIVKTFRDKTELNTKKLMINEVVSDAADPGEGTETLRSADPNEIEMATIDETKRDGDDLTSVARH